MQDRLHELEFNREAQIATQAEIDNEITDLKKSLEATKH
jgi:hypothetical protein